MLLGIVNPFSNQLNQFLQLEQTGRVQNRHWFKYAGARAGWSLIGPLARKSDRAGVFIEKREDIAASNLPHLENEKPLSRQRMKRVSYGGPSQMLIGTECSLLGVSRRCWTVSSSRRCIKYSGPSGTKSSHRTAVGFDPDAVRLRRSRRLGAMSNPANAGSSTWIWRSSSTGSTTRC